MKRAAVLAAMSLLMLGACGERETSETRLNVAPYGDVRVFRHKGAQHNVVILLSGSDGWKNALTDRALGTSWPDRTVIGVDLPTYLKNLTPSDHGGACLDFTAAMPRLLRAVSAATHNPVDPAPLVLGMGDGGTVALAAAAQSQPKSIEGVIAEDFCPRVFTALPPCPGPAGEAAVEGNALAPPKHLSAPFVAIADSEKCTAADLNAFTDAMPDARLVDPVPGRDVDLLISVAAQTGNSLVTTPAVSAADLADLPLIEIPGAPGRDERLAIIMTGDGGWADIDKSIGEALAARGIAVVGFNSLKYFWKERTPEDSAADLARVIAHYSDAWNRKRVMLIGYSFGAGVLPFLIPRLPEELRKTLILTSLLAPSTKADFEISVGGWIGDDTSEGPDVAAAMAGIEHPVLCVRSEEEDDSPCPAQSKAHIESVVLPGDHHFDGAYAKIADRILKKSAATP